MSLCSLTAFAQYPVSSINISIPNNPPPNIADWATTAPPLIIIAQAKLVQGKVPPRLEEGRILVLIKRDGGKICGSFTQQTAPLCNFNSATKSWSGAVALALLGNGCILKPGTYQLCVQFFSSYAPAEPLSNEVCKSFTIADDRQIIYSPPQNLAPVDGKNFTEQEVKQPILLRWTQVVPPPPNNDIVYTVRVYAVENGQPPAQALKYNIPVYEKDDGITQTIWQMPAIYSSSKENKTFVWNVQARNKAGKAYGKNNGVSEASIFNVVSEKQVKDTIADKKEVIYTPPQNLAPADCKNFTMQEANQPIQFRWTHITPRPPDNDIMYTIHIYAIEKGQTPGQAVKNNRPVYEKDFPTTQTTWQIPAEYLTSNGKKPFAWYVEAFRAKAAVRTSLQKSKIWIFCPDCEQGINWCSDGQPTSQVPVNNRPDPGVCKNFAIEYTKVTNRNPSSYEFNITNKYTGTDTFYRPKSFKINVKNNTVVAIDGTVSKEWIRTPSKFPPGSNSLSWTNISGIPNQTNLGIMHFGIANANPFYVIYEWLNKEGKTICKDSIAFTESPIKDTITKRPIKDTITKVVQIIYTAPEILMPVDCKNFTEQEVTQPIQFRWTQVTPPPPNNDIMYTIHVYAIEKGQTPEQAVKNNKPVFEKDVNSTQEIWRSQQTSNSLRGKIFVWYVESYKGKGIDKTILQKSKIRTFCIHCEQSIAWCPFIQPAIDPQTKPKKQPIGKRPFYYSLLSEYSGEAVDVTDTLFIQIDNSYSSGSNKLTYTIRNLSNTKTPSSDKTASPTKLGIKNNQGLIRIHLPLQNSGVAKGETGLLILNDYKKYYYISFKRN